MDIRQELKHLSNLLDAGLESEYQQKFEQINSAATSDEDRRLISEYILNGIHNIDNELQEIEKIIAIQEQLQPIKDIVSLSYIAKNYFGKSAAWLQQRIYGYKVRGKVYTLSAKDIDTLNFALQDISRKIGSIVIQ